MTLPLKKGGAMKTYLIEWYIDYPGFDGIRELEVEAEDENKAREEAWDILSNHLTLGEANEK